MLNEERIKLMTKLAIYEQSEGKEDLPLSKYYRTDYLTLKMINSAITMTIGYILVLVAIVVVNAEELLAELVGMDLLALGRKILIYYIILFIANMIATYLIYSYKFSASRDNLNKYNAMLKELYGMYKKEGNNEGSAYTEDFDIDAVDITKNAMAEFGGFDDDEIIND